MDYKELVLENGLIDCILAEENHPRHPAKDIVQYLEDGGPYGPLPDVMYELIWAFLEPLMDSEDVYADDPEAYGPIVRIIEDHLYPRNILENIPYYVD